MKVGEIKGLKSMRALNAFSALSIGLKMTPDYASLGFAEMFKTLQEMEPEEQANKIREAVMIVNLEDHEIVTLLSFCSDKNGVPYSSENIKNLSAPEIVDAIVAVCMEIVKMKITSISEDEKKN